MQQQKGLFHVYRLVIDVFVFHLTKDYHSTPTLNTPCFISPKTRYRGCGSKKRGKCFRNRAEWTNFASGSRFDSLFSCAMLYIPNRRTIPST